MQAIYKKTKFDVEVGNQTYTFDYQSVPKTPPFNEPFMIITAWNPMNQPLTREENDARNAKLFRELIMSRYYFERAVGYLDEHFEESYCVFDISLDDAIAMGKRYEQDAILYSEASMCGYYDVQTRQSF